MIIGVCTEGMLKCYLIQKLGIIIIVNTMIGYYLTPILFTQQVLSLNVSERTRLSLKSIPGAYEKNSHCFG